ncbi:MaoC/PaaZ C-terminal domain-containing protein [Microbacterium aquimaris]|uniref:MaoC/PaaZ C-terminal domain-containing protein n=1 Tax=Microbacterium aquimaris TaxID=459816 RepID=UPI002AD38204|nr:MaoC/PaaZ C-terminal domain-containing protein [Microbacterium aquimaris]MDZ8275053.1 MaoC/PaaZ C-terminal domain-containing protein [Microbacterium aquimaris]
MTIDTAIVGARGKTVERSWTSTDALLYAVAVGAGQEDASKELAYTTENSRGVEQQALPSMICVTATAPLPEGLEIDFTKLLHAQMGFTLDRPIPVNGSVRATGQVDGVYDKGSGALIATSTEVVDAASGDRLAVLESGLFIRGAGGFGGEKSPSAAWSLPERDPDDVRTLPIPTWQALVYRLTGDRNPLHSDPAFAEAAGFPAPILHGMASYGYSARALVNSLVGEDTARFRSMFARFTKPVFPGEVLTLQVWRTDEGAVFRTLDSAGDVVLDRGVATVFADAA